MERSTVSAEMAEDEGWPSPEVFQLLQAGDLGRLRGCGHRKLRPFLPFLVKMALGPGSFPPAHNQAATWAQDRKLVLSLINGV